MALRWAGRLGPDTGCVSVEVAGFSVLVSISRSQIMHLPCVGGKNTSGTDSGEQNQAAFDVLGLAQSNRTSILKFFVF